MKGIKVLKSFLLAGFLFICFTGMACKIGLGATVDTTPPNVTIEKPAAGAVIRGSFAMSGSWTDDGSIKSVSVSLRNLSVSGAETKILEGDFTTADLEEEENTWSCSINPGTDGLQDGSYEATVSVKDNGGHTTSVIRSFVIDNTAPVIILQRPSSKATDDINSVDSYGQTFTLEGQAADDNDVSRIDVNIYADSDCTQFLRTVQLSNVPSTIELDVTKYGDEAYTAIYGSEMAGTKQYYCTLTAYDGAQAYPEGTNQTADDTLGNYTTNYYLYEEVSSLITAYKASGLYHILSGTYEAEDSSRSSEIIKTTKEILDEKKIIRGTFTLNPKNNPTFTVNGKSALLAADEMDFSSNDDYEVTNGTELTVEISPGLDSIPISYDSDDDLKVYVKECDKNGNTAANTAQIVLPEKETKKSGSNYKITVKLNTQETSALVVGKYYIFGVEGSDTSGNIIESSAETGYGFKLASSGSAPTLTITEPAGSIKYLKKGDGLQIIGTTIVEEGYPVISLISGEGTEEETEWLTQELTDSDLDKTYTGTKRKYNFVINLDSAKFDQTTSAQYAFSIRSTVSGKYTTLNKTIMYDVEGPEINITSVNPAISSYEGAAGAANNSNNYEYINGKITVKGNVVDSFGSVNSVTWSVLQDNNAVPGLGGTISSVFSFEVDTTKLTDCKNATILITATDSSGNETNQVKMSGSDTLSNLNYFVDQSTDKPTMEAQDGKSWKVGILNPNYIQYHLNDAAKVNVIASGNSIYSRVCDDDGVSSVTFTVEALSISGSEPSDSVSTDEDNDGIVDVYKKDAARYTVNTAATEQLNAQIQSKTYSATGTEASVTHQMPTTAGFYLVTETVKDVNSNEKTGSYVIKITGTAPEVTLSRATKYVRTAAAAGEEISVNYTVNGELPYIIKRTVYKNSAAEETTILDTRTIADFSTGEYSAADSFDIYNVDFSKGVTYTVSDGSGGETIKTLEYTVDDAVPETLSILTPATDISSTVDNSLKGSDASFRGEAEDSLSGVKYLYYTFTSSDVTTAPDSGSFTKQSLSDKTWNINISIVSASGDADGTTKLAEGNYKLWVMAEDAAGNKTAAVSRIFSIDQAAPVISDVKLNGSISLEQNSTNYFKTDSGDFEITGTITETNGLSSFVAAGSVITPAADGTWTKTISRSENTISSIIIAATDNAGRITTETYRIYCDTTAPSVSITNPDSDLSGTNSLSGSSYTFRGSVNDSGSGIAEYRYAFLDSVLTAAQIAQAAAADDAEANGWTVLTSGSGLVEEKTLGSGNDLVEGQHYLYMYVKDNAGNTNTAARSFWVDLADPELDVEDVTTPTNGSVEIKGTAGDTNALSLLTLKLDSETAEELVLTGNSFDKAYTSELTKEDGKSAALTDGKHTFVITATDAAGKTKQVTKTVLVDTKAPEGSPEITTDKSASGWYKTRTLALKISTVTEAGSGVSAITAAAYKDAETTAAATTDLNKQSDGTYKGNLILNEDGYYTIKIVMADNAGNTNENNPRVVVANVDTTAPEITAAEVETPTKDDVIISGTVTETNLSALTIKLDSNTADTVDVNDDGTFSSTYTTADLTDGSHKFVITAADMAGNSSSITKTVLVDTTAPTKGEIEADSYGLQVNTDYILVNTTEKWFTAETYTAKILESSIIETGSGIDSVELKLVKSGEEDDLSSGTQMLTRKKPDADNVYKYTGKTDLACQGANDVKVKVKDNAGNITIDSIDVVYFDTYSPTLTVYEDATAEDTDKITVTYNGNSVYWKEASGSKLTNGSSTQVVYLKPEDNAAEGEGTNSGIDYVKYIYKDTSNIEQLLSVDTDQTGMPAGYYKLTIPANINNGIQYQPKGSAKFKVADKAGNTMTVSPFTFDTDTTSPSVSIGDVTDADTSTTEVDVNKTLKLSGTSSDENKVNSVELKYFAGTTEPTADQWTAGKVSADGDIKSAIVTGTTNWSATIDTTALTDGTNLYVKAAATDSAGNTGVSDVQTYYINQDSDRPVITFNNLDLSQTPTIWLMNILSVYGSLSDDDGVSTFSYSTDSGTSWNAVTLSGGSWSIPVSEGPNTIWFKVTDKAGTEFCTGNTNLPKLKSDNGSITDGILTFSADKTSPAYKNLKYKTSGVSDFTNDTSLLYFGGIYTTFDIKLTASDANGVTSVTAKFNDNSYSLTCSDASYSDSSEHEWVKTGIPIPADKTANMDIELTITDASGTKREDSVTISVDNTAPSFSFGTSQNRTLYATDSNEISGSCSSSDLDKWYYKLTDTINNTTYETAYAELPAGSTFMLTFDGGDGNLPTLFSEICTLEGITSTSLSSDDVTREMAIVVYGTDKAGNVSSPVTLNMNVIPNGDKPSVEFTYPTKAGASLGGVIRLTGSTKIKTSSVSSVYVQIDPSPAITASASADGTYLRSGSEGSYTYSRYTGSKYTRSGTDENPVYTVDETNGTYIKTGDSTYVTAAANLYEITAVSFSSNWTNNLTAAQQKLSTSDSAASKIVSTGCSTSGYDYAYEASGTDSWNLVINQSDEFNANKFIALRAFAVSKTGKESELAETWINMDPDAPIIGSRIQLQLVQYAYTADVTDSEGVTVLHKAGDCCTDGSISSGTVAKRINYEPDMWVSGKWYLIGSVDDGSGIKHITLKDSTGTSDLVKVNDSGVGEIVKYVTKNGSALQDGNFNYDMNILVGNTTDKFGSLTYVITATEATTQNLISSQYIYLNYDNKAPDFEATYSDIDSYDSVSEKMNRKLPSSGTKIQQSSGTYTIRGVFDESGENDNNQSGFSRVAMYFTRDITVNSVTTTYVIDPMLSGSYGNAADGRGNFKAVTSADLSGGLYWITDSTVEIKNSNLLTSTNEIDKRVRKGGIVKIDGSIYKIAGVDYENKQITINGTVQNTASNETTTVYYALAQIIDNTTTETGTTAEFNFTGSLASTTNDDGDQMIEGAQKSGTTYSLSASINSSLIMDGPVTMHFVAFDAAGNSTPKAYDATVSNNAPRLYGVKYGTDTDGNGTIDDDEWVTDYSQKYSVLENDITYDGYENVDSTKVAKTSITVDDSKRLTIKGLTKVTPQIAGGNVGLGYTYTYVSGAANKDYPAIGVNTYENAGHSSATTWRSSTDLTISISTADFLSNNVDEDDQLMTFKVWDKTDGTTAGSTTSPSNVATINLPVKVAIKDEDPPVTKIKPFYWNSSSDNSLYNNSTDNGHIELEGDLPAAFTDGAADDEMDRDPKVSGLITFDGYVTDNVIIKEISAVIPGYNSDNSFVLATRSDDGTITENGSYNSVTLTTQPSDWPAGYYTDNKCTTAASSTYANGTYYKMFNWYFEKTDDSYAEDGTNQIDFKLHFNTEKIDTVAATNVKVVVSAKDRGCASLKTAYATDAEAAAGSYYSTVALAAAAGTADVTIATGDTPVKGSADATETTVYEYTYVGYTPKSSTADTDSTTTGALKNLYQVDVVPYITGISTPIRTSSGLKDNNIRSASGKYSVIKGSTSDSIVVTGFNLNPTAARIVSSTDVTGTVSATSGTALSITTSASSPYTEVKLSNAGTKSGYLELFVNGVRTLNNINSNDAHGSFTFTGGTADARTAAISDYADMPNREADYYTTKNVQLTDDRYIRFFDMKDTGVKNGYYPTMIMNGDNPVFGYLDKVGGTTASGAGSNYPQYAMPQRAEFNSDDGSEVYTEYLIKAPMWDQMGMAVDEGGRYYNVSVYDRDGCSMSLIYDRFAENYDGGSGFGAGIYIGSGWTFSSDSNNNAITLESVNYGSLQLSRYQYPKLIAKGNSKTGTANVYMAYYDDGTGEIVVRDFMVGKKVAVSHNETSTVKIPSGTTYTVTYTSNRFRFNSQSEANAMASQTVYLCDSNGYVIGTATTTQVQRSNSGNYYYVTISSTSFDTGYSESSVVSMASQSSGYTTQEITETVTENILEGNGSGVSTYALDSSNTDNDGTLYEQYVNFAENTSWGSTTYKTGRIQAVETGSKYFDMKVTSDNHIIIVYYDEVNSKLKLLYSTNAVTGSDPTATVAWTTSSLSLPEYVGNYVSMALDSKDGIHISAFNSGDSDLSYIYIPTYYASSYTHYTVDQYGAVGNWTQIKINSANQPVIAYTNATENGQRDAIKLAYATGTLDLSGTTSAIGTVAAGVDSNNYTTGAWEYMTVPAITPPQGGDSKFQNVCLDFDSTGYPVVGYLGTDLEFGKWLTE